MTRPQTPPGPRVASLEVVEVDTMPLPLEHGKLYISRRFELAIHLCACGCAEETVMPFRFLPWEQHRGWQLVDHGNAVVTFHPSVGNHNMACRSHYWIEKNRIRWC